MRRQRSVLNAPNGLALRRMTTRRSAPTVLLGSASTRRNWLLPLIPPSQSDLESEAESATLRVRATAPISDRVLTEETVEVDEEEAVAVAMVAVMVTVKAVARMAPEKRQPRAAFLTTQQRRPRRRSVLLGSLETRV
jgi:hypothetical protein